jgi:hypothetical protein
MSMRSTILAVTAALAVAFQAGAVVYLSPNLLADPGFESGTVVPSAVGGWNTLNGAAFSQDSARSGQWSMRSPFNPSSFNAPVVQYVPATPGVDYTLTAWGFTPTILDSTQRAFLIMSFAGSNGGLLGGFLVAPLAIDSASPANTWIEMSLTATAPVDTAFVFAEVSAFDFSNGSAPPAAVYFDDLNLIAVPEPSVFTLLGFGAGTLVLWRRRR